MCSSAGETRSAGGCVGLAALSSGEIDLAGKCVAVVLSGGNVDFGTYAGIMAAA